MDLKFGIHHIPLSDHKLAQFRDNLSELSLIIIDEFSLVGADMLYRIHMRLREIFQCDDLFANKSILLVGDILQLPPVKETYIFNRPYNKKFWGLYHDNNLWRSFTPIVLKKCFRQGDDRVWASTLNRLREGIVTEEDEALLKTRLTKKDFMERNAMHVFYKNEDVKDHNEKMLNKLDTPIVTMHATKIFPKGRHHPVITPQGTIDSTQFLDKLDLKIGSRVRLTFNIKTTDELVNGSFGEVVGFEYNSSGNVEFVIVSFDDKSAGKAQREKYPRISAKYKEVNGTPIERHEQEYHPPSKKGFSHSIRCKVIQFPLKLCWASTAHSMQGMTVKKGCALVVHFSNRFQPGMAYVMLGRCERLQDIHISGDFSIDKIKCSTEAVRESTRLLEEFDASLERNLETKDCLRISYLNVMGLWSHLDDLKQSSRLMSSTVLGLGETWMDPGAEVDLPNFSHGTYENVGGRRGLAAFSKGPAHVMQTSFEGASGIKLDINGIHILFFYLSHGVSWSEVNQLLNNWISYGTPTIIMGDMNWHFDPDSTHHMKLFLESRGFHQMVERATHNQGNCIDHIYLNKEVSTLGPEIEIQSTYFSDHDIITVLFPAIKLVI